MRINGIVWLHTVVEKLEQKHNLHSSEVEEVFAGQPKLRHLESGDVVGEDLYLAMGRTAAGRYLTVFFINKAGGQALVVTARDMTPGERKAHGKK